MAASRSRSRNRYVLGLDFGTLSGRAVVVNADTGEEVATAVGEYRHGVIERELPGSKRRLEPETALQHPGDYLEVLERVVPRVMREARVRPEQVVGIGTDFTSCTMMPVRADGRPLCWDARWRGNPHAWVKLWKHHAAQPEANRINEVGWERGEAFIEAYGGKYSSEWFFSKLLQTVNDAPAVYRAADRFLEAGDWLVWQLCGREGRSVSAAGFKGMRVYPVAGGQVADGVAGWGYPGQEFFKALHPALERVVAEKIEGEVLPLGRAAGGLTGEMARRLGLMAGTPVASGNIDAHVAVPACGVTAPGRLVMILGTSTCHLLVGEERRVVEGMCGVVRDGVVPGAWGYEAGQSGVGDLFAWYVDQGAPAWVAEKARRERLTAYQWLEREAGELEPGESGLLALDWWNGNRSVLVDADLTGLLVGLNLGTRPGEIYRALFEATAFGTRRIIEAFTERGVAIEELYACGGLAQKSPLLMQIYADVTGRSIRVVESEQTCALGAAMHGAVAAGVHRDMHEAARRMASPVQRVYRPKRVHREVYGVLYGEYGKLHDAMGRDAGGVMKVLKRLRAERYR